jgi:hypothetical protein
MKGQFIMTIDPNRNDFDDIASQAWEEQKTPLEKMYDIWTDGQWEPQPPQITYRPPKLIERGNK